MASQPISQTTIDYGEVDIYFPDGVHPRLKFKNETLHVSLVNFTGTIIFAKKVRTWMSQTAWYLARQLHLPRSQLIHYAFHAHLVAAFWSCVLCHVVFPEGLISNLNGFPWIFSPTALGKAVHLPWWLGPSQKMNVCMLHRLFPLDKREGQKKTPIQPW